ncbi:MAG: transpeptidase family protein [Spirochaetaceae bacterium]|jgi:cell division protein FtsI (penicillin-binding protein 3)|nr:transpeptidase family protein [Spirochaetaceae bacterium]
MTGYTNIPKTEERKGRRIPAEQRRFIVFAVLFCLAAFIVLGRYAVLMLSPEKLEPANSSRILIERGPITDRNGRILALQTRLANITAWRPDVTDLDAFCQDLAPVLGYSPEDIRKRIEESASDFIYLKKQVDQSTIQKIELLLAGERIAGAGIDPIFGRIYPEKRLAGQIIGFVGDDNTGLAGIEHAMEAELTNSAGQVVLTIDTNVQYILEGIARRTMIENAAEAVMFMAMDPRTGEILGSASLPDFDPNDIRSSDEQGRMDRPAIWAYEPGSVFKVFSLASLMDAGSITDQTVFVCNGHYERVTSRGERIVINCLAAHGPVTAREIIIYSCNAGANYAADRMGTAAFADSLRSLGFGARTGAGNPGETAGFLRPAERWSDRSKPTIAMGQEISVSALQMLQAATAIANDGILVPPRIVSRVVSADGKTIRTFDPGPPRRVLSGETARTMRSYMTDVTSSIGTGWRANVEDLSLAVKTGTAQITNPQTGAYSSTDFIANCIALLPADSPSLVLYLVIVKPKGEYLGGRVAAPPIREAAEALVDYLGIPRGRNPQVEHSGSIVLPPNRIPVIGAAIPDFTGFSKRQLIPLILRDDLSIELSGDGWVRRQYPPPGTPFTTGMVITLELE